MDYTFGDDAVDEIEAMLRKEQARGVARPTFDSGRVAASDIDDSDDDYSDDFDGSVAGRSAAGQSAAGRRSEIEEAIKNEAAAVVPPLLMGPEGGRPADPDTSHYPPVVPHDGHAPTVKSQRSSRQSGDRSSRRNAPPTQRSISENVPSSFDDRVRERTQSGKFGLAAKGSRRSNRNGGAASTSASTSARTAGASAASARSARGGGQMSHRQRREAEAAKRRAETLRKLQGENGDLQQQVQVLRDRLDAAQAAAQAREERERKVRLGLGRGAGSPRATDFDTLDSGSGQVDVEALEYEMKLRDIDEVLDQANEALIEASAENALLKHQADAGLETSVVHQVKEVRCRCPCRCSRCCGGVPCAHALTLRWACTAGQVANTPPGPPNQARARRQPWHRGHQPAPTAGAGLGTDACARQEAPRRDHADPGAQ